VLYRENGQFKTSYAADQQIFPIAQDRWAIIGILVFAFIAVPLLVDEYLFRAILIPFLILSLAALGVNILVGFCGQITLGAGAFMAVGAYAAYNFHIRVEACRCSFPCCLAASPRPRGHLLRYPESARAWSVSGGRHPGGTVLHRLGFSARSRGLRTMPRRARFRSPTCR
jgi:uncharacterized membrane protein